MTHDEILNTVQEVIDNYIPIGTIQCFAMKCMPKVGIWMECDGSLLDKSEYSHLYSIIGDSFSYDINDSNTFRIPNLQGQFIRGYDPDCNVESAPRNFGSIQKHAIQGHLHKIDVDKSTTGDSGNHTHTVRASEVEINNGAFSSQKVLRYLLNSGSDSANSDESGSHSHSLPMISVGMVKEYGSHGYVNVARETRPTNVALMFCIRVL